MIVSGIALARQPSAFPLRIESHIDIGRAIPAIVTCGRPHMMRQGFQSQDRVRRLDVGAVDVQIVGAPYFCSVQFGSTDEHVNQSIHVRESGFRNLSK